MESETERQLRAALNRGSPAPQSEAERELQAALYSPETASAEVFPTVEPEVHLPPAQVPIDDASAVRRAQGPLWAGLGLLCVLVLIGLVYWGGSTESTPAPSLPQPAQAPPIPLPSAPSPPPSARVVAERAPPSPAPPAVEPPPHEAAPPNKSDDPSGEVLRVPLTGAVTGVEATLGEGGLEASLSLADDASIRRWFVLQNPSRLVVDVNGARPARQLRHPGPGGMVVRAAASPEGMRVVFDLPHPLASSRRRGAAFSVTFQK